MRLLHIKKNERKWENFCDEESWKEIKIRIRIMLSLLILSKNLRFIAGKKYHQQITLWLKPIAGNNYFL